MIKEEEDTRDFENYNDGEEDYQPADLGEMTSEDADTALSDQSNQ